MGGKVVGAYNTAKGIKGLFGAGGAGANLAQSAILNLGVAGESLGSGAASIGGLAAAGTAGIAGGAVGGVTLISAGADFLKALKSDDKKESNAYKASAGWKAGGVAAGAAAGEAIGTILPVISVDENSPIVSSNIFCTGCAKSR